MTVQTKLTSTDRCRLGQLLSSEDIRGMTTWQMIDDLEWRLEEADAVQPESIADDVVIMNSTVRLVHAELPLQVAVTVVYPEDVDLIDEGVSVLEPLGACLVGCEAGDVVECEKQLEPGQWRIAEILFQPERAGKFEL